MNFLKKCFRFLGRPHRLVALLLGLSFLLFTQFVVFQPSKPMVDKKPAQKIRVSVAKETKVPVEVIDDFDFEELYFDDLIEALDEMVEPEFSGLSDLNVALDKASQTDLNTSPKIAIVIDDLGMNRKQSWASVDLDFPVTLAFLPYAENIQEMADKGREKGHDVILHVPMQPLDEAVNAGENVLKNDQSEVLIRQALDKNFAALTYYDGMNNHMGSAFTQNEKGMNIVMTYLKEKGGFYLDSRTTAESVAEKMASRHGVPFVSRDVFLDHEETYEYAEGALEQLERIALEKGRAIAIGHPKEVTLKALNDWVKGAQAKGIEFVPLSKLIQN